LKSLLGDNIFFVNNCTKTAFRTSKPYQSDLNRSLDSGKDWFVEKGFFVFMDLRGFLDIYFLGAAMVIQN